MLEIILSGLITMHPFLKVYHDSVFDFLNNDFEIETWANDCLFTEGPVWSKEGFYLFSDITANCIYKIVNANRKEVYLANSGTNEPHDTSLKPDQIGSNGLAYDWDGKLLVCRHGSHEIAKYDGQELETFINSYHGKPLNSPNDLILHRDGRLYFSDPPYGLKDGKSDPEKFQPLAGVYCWKAGELKLVCDKYQYPNGVCLSNDQTRLYICSNKPSEKFISVYKTSDDTFLNFFAEENSDGIEVDKHDNVYLCNKDGLIILNAKGERMALIELATIPANICWGGENMNDLFITARENIFLIRNLQKD